MAATFAISFLSKMKSELLLARFSCFTSFEIDYVGDDWALVRMISIFLELCGVVYCIHISEIQAIAHNHVLLNFCG